ncbi:hypothetical protein XM38_012960 [Halomicronema hongdechloris C2206]|uniref:Uncharacterized protein n=1 Tax=Halomicronema hongdechloris C2206 TaxID=1641165 RepID=A0A1Z3HJ83_9CYAN|nr:hypothetical protein [Halomicronema hongdechloris]ASC70358.1 hypothetical protein XM38_012960 [Halomicronema hongdechloris C2206]
MTNQALRFLLHGSPEHYDNIDTLYVASQTSAVWGKVARQILDPWRILSPDLIKDVSQNQLKILGIQLIAPQNLIQDLNATALHEQDFSDEERREILKQVSIYGTQELWQSLPLHTSADGKSVPIADSTYLNNPDFTLPSQLRTLVTIIPCTNRPDWIPLWTPKSAISVILKQPRPDQYCELLLQLMQVPDSDLNEEFLKHIKEANWLKLKTEQSIAPKNVILLPSYLADFRSKLQQVFQSEHNCSYASYSMLKEELQESPALRQVCEEWYDNDILEFLLQKTQKPFDHVCLILKILSILEKRNQSLRKTIIEPLKTTEWLVGQDDQPRSPQQIIDLQSIDLEATEILRQQPSSKYITPGMLRDDLDIRFCLESNQIKPMFLSGTDAIKQLGNAIADLPEYYLGDLPDSLLGQLAQTLQECSHTPALLLKHKISSQEFEEFILPKVRHTIHDLNRLKKILDWLATQYPNPSSEVVTVYNYFLKISSQSLASFREVLLPHIQLLNQQGEWRSPEQLCDGERYTGIDNASVLHSSQRTILGTYLEIENEDNDLEAVSSVSKVIRTGSAESITANSQALEQYFRPWLSHLPSEAVGGLLCLFAGTNQDVQNLAKKYLQSRSFDGLRERVLWSENLRNRNFRIAVKSVEGAVQTVRNLLREDIDVSLQQNKVPEHIFVGQLDHSTQEIVLLKFNLPEDNGSLAETLINSARVLLQRIHRTETESIEEIWRDLLNSQQLYVKSARNYILQHLPVILRMLNINDQDIRKCLDQIGSLESELEELNLRRDARVNQRKRVISDQLEERKTQLIEMIETDHGSLSVLQTVRRKIEHGQYGYDISNIPFELFQNADDALLEYERLLGQSLPERNHFVLSLHDQGLTIMHWGRPINMVTHPDVQDEDSELSGFKRDLVKMLSFSDSSKGEDETGKFGLGFKTVHLLSRQPCVISGDIKFIIYAGLLPRSLPRPGQEDEDEGLTSNLRRFLQEHSPSPDINDGTIINLPFDSEILDPADSATESFYRSVGLLLVFSKRIKSCTLLNEAGGEENTRLTWSPQPVLGISEVEFGQIRLPKFNGNDLIWQSHNLLNFNLRSGNVAFVIPSDLSENSPLLNSPKLWVTNPTKESLNIRFVVNSHFDITTGRTSLDRNSKRNQDLIRDIGMQLGEVLCGLFFSSEGNWLALRQALHLNETISAYHFWNFLWDVLVKDWLRLNSDETILQLLKAGFSTEYYGCGYLISCHASLPNGLFGNARQLVRFDQITHKITGILSDQEIFNIVSNWPNFEDSSSRWVHHQVWQDVVKLMGTSSHQPSSLKLADILVEALGNRNVNPEIACSIGNLVNPSRMTQWKVSHLSEYEAIRQVLDGEPLGFMNQAAGYLAASLLLVTHTGDLEERRLVAFAPSNRILHSDYTDTALEFFRVCRPRRETIAVEELVEWARSATTEEQRQAVRVYLSSGERSLEFSRQLQSSIENTWMKDDPAIRSLLQTKARQLQEERAIQGEIPWEQISSLDNDQASQDSEDPPEEPNPNDSRDLLDDIYRWWKEQGGREIRDYNQRLYPIGINELTQGLRDGNRSTWLMLFFIGATHTMGRTRHEQHRDFIRFCINQGWWNTFSESDPQDASEQWIYVLNDYLESLRQDTTWYYWMEKYPNIYQISKYLDEYQDSFLRAERIPHRFELVTLTNPRLASDLSGGGVDAPPLRLGIGANFVIRELVRFEIIEPTEYIFSHCFVPRAKIRRIMMRLGCQGLQSSDYRHSRHIYTFLQKEFKNLDLSDFPTFQNCFDIPFELYAKRHSLDLRGLLVREDLGWYEGLSDEDYFEDEPNGN